MELTERMNTNHVEHQRKSIFGEKRPNTYKSYKQMLYISSMYYISFVYFGYIMMYFNSLDFAYIMRVFGITMAKDTAQGVYSGLPALGACLGSYIAKYFIQRFSRNENFFICNVAAIVGGIFVLIPNMNTLFLGRLIQGVCVGFFCSITPMTVKQLSPIELGGTMNGVNNIAISLGYFIGYFFGWMSTALFKHSQYKYVLVFSVTFFISIVQIVWVKYLFPYETPKYLLSKGKIAQAKQVIQKIYLLEYQDRIFQEKKLEVEYANICEKQVDDRQTSSEPIINTKVQSCSKTDIFAAFSASYLVVAQQMTGFNVFLLYGSQIARQYLPALAVSLSMMISLEKLVITALASFFLFNLLGRKVLLVIGSAVCTLSLYSVVYGGYKIQYDEPGGQVYIFLGIFVCIFSVAATQGPLTWVYISQVLQPSAIPFIVFMKWFTNFLSVATFPILRQHSQDKSCVKIFLGYFLFTLVSTVIFQYILVETKDKNEIQIHEQLQKKQESCENLICKCQCFRNTQYRINTHWNRQ